MSWSELREVSIDEAKGLLRDRSSHYGKKHSRFHADGQDHVSQQIRAINGICGDCRNLWTQAGSDNRGPYQMEMVVMRCMAGKDPVTLYRYTQLGVKAECDKFQPK